MLKSIVRETESAYLMQTECVKFYYKLLLLLFVDIELVHNSRTTSKTQMPALSSLRFICDFSGSTLYVYSIPFIYIYAE